MLLTITARHTTAVTDDLKARADELVQRLASHAHRPQRAEVIFDEDHQRKLVELHVFLPHGRAAIATAEAADFPTALDRAADKLKHQLDGKVGQPAARRRTVSNDGAT